MFKGMKWEACQESCYFAKEVKILIIDDNEMNLEVIGGFLKETQAQIDTALSGEEGLTKVRQTRYDLILLDQMMPGMDGIETLRQLQQLDNVKKDKIPVIALTADSVAGAREEYLRHGFTDYIAKPVDYRTLIVCIRKYLPGRIVKCSQPESSQRLCEEYLTGRGIQVQSAMKYAGDEIEQYIHLLDMFSGAKGLEKLSLLQQAYESHNWKDYTIYVHGLKNGARTIGADGLADMAYEHEKKSKSGEIAFLQENYQRLIQEWEKTRDIILSGVELYKTEQKEADAMQNENFELEDSVWQEMLRQIMHYLEGYRKKEALALLTQLAEDKGRAKKNDNLKQAIDAVTDYDYEKAIQLLRDR